MVGRYRHLLHQYEPQHSKSTSRAHQDTIERESAPRQPQRTTLCRDKRSYLGRKTTTVAAMVAAAKWQRTLLLAAAAAAAGQGLYDASDDACNVTT